MFKADLKFKEKEKYSRNSLRWSYSNLPLQDGVNSFIIRCWLVEAITSNLSTVKEAYLSSDPATASQFVPMFTEHNSTVSVY